MRILLTAYKGNAWTVAPCLHLFEKYWGDPKQIDFIAEDDYSNGKTNFIKAKEEWIRDGVFRTDMFASMMDWYLPQLAEDYFIFTHADYWLTRPVDHELLSTYLDLMRSDYNIMRAEIGFKTSDYYDLCKKNSVFSNLKTYECASEKRDCFLTTSFDMAIWNRNRLAEILCHRPFPNLWSGWNVETEGADVYNKKLLHLRSLMATPAPIHYMNTIYARNNEIIKITKQLHKELEGLIPLNVEVIEVSETIGACPYKCCGW